MSGIFLATAGKMDFPVITVVDAEQAGFHIEDNPFAGKETAQVTA